MDIQEIEQLHVTPSLAKYLKQYTARGDTILRVSDYTIIRKLAGGGTDICSDNDIIIAFVSLTEDEVSIIREII